MTLPPDPPARSFIATVINGVIHLPPGARLEEGSHLILTARPLGQKNNAEHYADLVGRVSGRCGNQVGESVQGSHKDCSNHPPGS